MSKFFYAGSYYETEEEFWKGVYEYNRANIDHTSLEYLFSRMIDDLKLNLSINPPNMSNSEFREKLEKIFIFSLKELLQLENQSSSSKTSSDSPLVWNRKWVTKEEFKNGMD